MYYRPIFAQDGGALGSGSSIWEGVCIIITDKSETSAVEMGDDKNSGSGPPPPVFRGRDTDGANGTGSGGAMACGKAGAVAGIENDVVVVSGKIPAKEGETNVSFDGMYRSSPEACKVGAFIGIENGG